MKTLVAYFSATGVTATAAQKIANALGADLFEIRPPVRYSNEDLDWENPQSRSSLEEADPHSRPEIAERVAGMEGYDRVLVGFPIWWYKEPRIIDTFLESYDFSGKILIPFATSGSSGIEQAQESLQRHCSAANWQVGRLLNDTDASSWAKQL